MFCASCPQLGINLPSDWQDDPVQYVALLLNILSLHTYSWCRSVYTCSLVFDGNFKLTHLKQWQPEDDVWLSNGTGMITEWHRYKDHIAYAIEDRLVQQLQ